MAYVDLTPIPWTAADLVSRAVSNLATRLPELRLLEGDLASLLLEEQAKIVSELIWAANRAPTVVMESLLLLYGVTRDPGAQAHATARFTVAAGSAPRVVPAGSRILVASQVFLTDAELTIATGGTTGDIGVTSESFTASLNGATGLTVAMLDAVAYVESVALVGAPHDGRNPEDLATYLDRGATTLSRLTSTLVRADQFATAALADPNVARAVAVDLYDPGQVPPENHAGHVTVAVLGQNGAVLTPAQKAAVQSALAAQAVAMLQIHVIDATVQAIAVTVDVHPVTGWTNADVKASVTATLSSYLSAARWSYGASVYRNELISIIDQAPGVERVIDITTPSGDVALTGIGAVASLGALTVKADGVVIP